MMKTNSLLIKLVFAGFLSFIFSQSLLAQDSSESEPIAVSSFFVEMGGAGLMFSANYDRRFSSINRLNKSNLGLGYRIGLGFFNDVAWYTNDRKSVATIPVQVNYIFGKPASPHTFEVGAGVTFATHKIHVFDDMREAAGNSVFASTSFMYRRQPAHGGFSWRVGFTPMVTGGYIEAYGGIGFGYNF